MEHPGVFIGLAAMWILFLVAWTVPAARRHEPHEAFASLCFAAFISLLFLVYSGAWTTRSVESLATPALFLQLAGLGLVAGAFYSLRGSDQLAGSADQAPRIVRSGVYGFTNHPMYLGLALWSASVGMGRFSPASAALAGLVVVLAVLASIKEDAYNVRKFGEPYADYRRTLPLQRAWAKIQEP